MNNVLKVLHEHANGKELERADRVFRKGLKFGVVEGDIIGYCESCGEWYNQSEIGSPLCPKHRRFFTRRRRM